MNWMTIVVGIVEKGVLVAPEISSLSLYFTIPFEEIF